MPLTIQNRSRVSTRFGELRVATAGSGPTELLVITPIGSAWMEQALPSEFQDIFTVNILELPGTGGSDGHPAAATVRAVADAASDAADSLANEVPILFGHSMNGTLALAAGATGRFGGVLAVTPPPQLPPSVSASTAYWEAKAEPERRERGAALIAEHEDTKDEQKRLSSSFRGWITSLIGREGSGSSRLGRAARGR